MSFARFARTRLRAALLVLAALIAPACGDLVTGPGEERERTVRGLTLGVAALTMAEGDTLRLSPTALDQRGQAFEAIPTGLQVAWSSADTAVAVVDASGLVTARGSGSPARRCSRPWTRCRS